MQKLTAKIKDGKVWPDNKKLWDWTLLGLDGKDVVIEIKKKVKSRTDQQNKALHLWFTLLADELNNAGFDVRKTLNEEIEHPWTGELIKELIWRKVQISMLGKKSTTKLTTDEIDKVFEVINRHLGEKFGIHVPFPCIENLMGELTPDK